MGLRPAMMLAGWAAWGECTEKVGRSVQQALQAWSVARNIIGGGKRGGGRKS